MPLTNKESVAIEICLEQVYLCTMAAVPDMNYAQIRKYIDIGKHGLALDDMACIALESSKPVAVSLRQLFNKAADLMAIKPGDGWSGVDNLLSHI